MKSRFITKITHYFLIILMVLQSLVYPWISLLPAPPGAKAQESPPLEATHSAETPAPSPLDPLLNLDTIFPSTPSSEIPKPEATPEATPSSIPEKTPEPLDTTSSTPSASLVPATSIAPSSSPNMSPTPAASSTSKIEPDQNTPKSNASIEISPFGIILHYPFEGNNPISYGFNQKSDFEFVNRMQSLFKVDAHDGIDFALPEGTSVLSTGKGTVEFAGAGEYGQTIIIKHSWGKSYYGHLSQINVSKGDTVETNQTIGISGSTGVVTGPHLHFGIEPNNPNLQNGFHGMIDPTPYFVNDGSRVLSASTSLGSNSHKSHRTKGEKLSFKKNDSVEIDLTSYGPGYQATLKDATGKLKNIKITNDLLNLNEQSNLKPGEYTLSVEDSQGNIVDQVFTLGVLTLNTDKDAYLPGETAYLQIGTLNKYGKTICDASLSLKIGNTSLSTANGTIVKNSTCGDDNVTDSPDYYAYYTFQDQGTYSIDLLNLDVNSSLTKNVEVKNSLPYQIKRIGATRINPFKSTYQMNLEITAQENWSGTITEKVPKDFILIDSKATWNIDLVAGQTQKLSYVYQAPMISPAIFNLGPLTIGAYTESRAWDLASDVACNASTTGNWGTAGTWTGCTGGGVPANTDTVTINSGVVVTVAASATIAGITIANPTVANGITISTGQTLQVNGNVAYTNNTATGINQTISLEGTSILNVTGSFDTGTPSGTGLAQVITNGTTVCSSCQLNVTGAVSIRNSSAATAGRGIIAMTTGATNSFTAGSLAIVGGTVGTSVATFSILTGTVTLNGNVTFSGTASKTLFTTTGIAQINLNNCSFGSSGTYTIAAGTKVTTTGTSSLNFTTQNWGLMTVTSGTLTASSGNITSTGVTITSGTFTLGGTMTLNGNLTNNSGTGAYAGAFATTFGGTGRTIGGSSATTFNALTLAASATVTANTSFTVTNALTFTSTTAAAQSLTLGSNTVTATLNTVTHNQPGGAFTSAFNVNAGTATISGAYTIPSTSTTTTRIATIVVTTGTVNANAGINTTGATGGSTAAVHVINMSGSTGNFNLKGAISTVSVAGASGWTFTMGTAGSNFNYVDTVAQTVYIPGAGAYNNLTINNTAGGTLNAAITAANVTGNVSVGNINSGSSFSSAGALAITGNAAKIFRVHGGSSFSMPSTSTYPTGFGTFTFDATSTVNYFQTTTPLAVTSATYGHLNLMPGGTATQNLPAGTLTVAGNLTCGNGINTTTCSANANSTTLVVGGSLTISTSGTFVAHASNSFSLAGDFSNGGTYTHSSGTLTLNGTVTQSILGASTTTFNNLTVTNTTAAISPTVSFNVAGTLNMNGANTIMTPFAAVVINNAGAAGTITGTGTVQVKRTAATADYSSQYKFTTNTLTNLTVDYAGSGQILSNLTYGPLKISGSISANANTATVGGAFTVTGTFAPSSGTITFTGGSISNSGTLTFADLTINGTTTTSSSFTINGALTLGASGNLSPSAGTISFATTGWTISNSGTLVFNSLNITETPSTQTSSSFSLNNTLTVSSTKTFAPLAGTITMNATTWAISNSGSLSFEGLTIAQTPSTQPTADFTIGAALTIASGKSLSPTAGTISLDNGASISNAAGTLAFNNLTLLTSAAVTSSGNFSVVSTMTVGTSASFTPGATDIISGAGTLTGSGTVKVTRTTATADFSTQYTITGKTLTNLTVEYAGTGQVLSNLIYGNLTISGSISTGANTASLTGNFTNSGTFTPSSGTITFAGADGSTQIITGNSTFANFTASTLSNSTGRTLRFTAGSTTTVTGTWTITGFTGKVITLESSTTSAWNITPTAASVDYATVSYSTSSLSICATHSTDGGNNNASWQFTSGTTCSSNTAPNSPSSLAQKTVADAVISTGSWVSATSIKFTATATDTDNPDTLQLCVEKDLLGVSFSNTEDSCGTGVSYTGTGVAVSVTISGQTDASEYHWQARIKDTAGAYSSWVSYDTNLESARDYGLDTTAPTGGTIYDGTSAGVDATFSTTSLSDLSANWASISSNVSGLVKYEYSIGTTAGATDIKTWTDNTTSTSVTATGLTLTTSQLYYFNVRTTDGAGNVSTPISSNGQLVAPSISFTVAPASVTFNNLNVGNSYTDTQNTTLTTSTNAYNGYVIRAFVTDFLRSTDTLSTIADFSAGSYASPATWAGAETGFGYTSSDTTIGGSNKFSSGTLYAPFSHTGPGDIVADHTTNVTGSPVSSEAFTLTYKVKLPTTQAAKRYSTTVVYTATAQY